MNESSNQQESEKILPEDSNTSSDGQSGIRKVPPAPNSIVPQNMEQVRLLLTGRDERFREPLTNREERDYQKVWRQGGKGFTKPQYSSSTTTQRKKRQRKRNKWAKARAEKRITKKKEQKSD